MGRLDDWHRRWRGDRWLQDRWRWRQLKIRWWLWKVDGARRRRCIEALRALAVLGWWWLARLLAWLVDRDCPDSRPPGPGDPRER
ncbi:MAG: hypothetical protein WCS09_01365 [Pseudomonadota bacterium]